MPIGIVNTTSVTSISLLYTEFVTSKTILVTYTSLFFNTCLSFFLLQHGVPAFTVSQRDEAMCVLEEKASQLGVSSMILFPYHWNMQDSGLG